MSDRIPEIRARLDAATPGPWDNGDEWDNITAEITPSTPYITPYSTVVAKASRPTDADLIANAPDDLAWLLDRFEAMRRALGTLAEMASWDGPGVGSKSLDDTLRYYGLSLSEVEVTE